MSAGRVVRRGNLFDKLTKWAADTKIIVHRRIFEAGFPRYSYVMKIISQTPEELVLKESRAKEITLGVLLLLFSLAIEIAENANPGSFSYGRGMLMPILFFVAGILVFLFSSFIHVDLNKITGQITYQKKRLIGTKSQQYPILDVIRIETRRRQVYRNRSQKLMTQSVLIFKDGTELPLDHEIGSSLELRSSSGVLMGAPGTETTTASTVASFLGVPFQEVAPPGTLTTEPPETTPKGVQIATGILLFAIFAGLAALAYFFVFKQ
jgi:hypothetical protein